MRGLGKPRIARDRLWQVWHVNGERKSPCGSECYCFTEKINNNCKIFPTKRVPSNTDNAYNVDMNNGNVNNDNKDNPDNNQARCVSEHKHCPVL